VDGVTTFQLQFKADQYCSKHVHHVLSTSSGSNLPPKWRSSTGKDLLLSQPDDDIQFDLLTEECEWEVEEFHNTVATARFMSYSISIWTVLQKCYHSSKLTLALCDRDIGGTVTPGECWLPGIE